MISLDSNLMRDVLISELEIEAKKDKNIILISNEQGAIALDSFRKNLPNQFINAGVSEQNIISAAAGMASAGKKVFVYSIATFITLRCLEQIKLDVGVMNLPVNIIGVGASFSYDVAGPSHHATEDISILRSINNLEIFSPSDNITTKNLLKLILKSKKPSYVRLDRENLGNFKNKVIKKTGFNVLGKKSKILLITNGKIAHIALDIQKDIKKFQIIDLYKIKPLNKKLLVKEIKKYKKVIVAEENFIDGGIGSSISELVADYNINIKLIRIGIKEKNLYNYNPRSETLKLNKLDRNSLKNLILKNL